MWENKNLLWNKFNLWEQNPDQGGGIIYCMRYSREVIEQKRKRVISVLDSLDIYPKEVDWNDIAIIPDKNYSQDNTQRILHLLEELSVLNGALEYKASLLDTIKNIEELSNLLISIYLSLLQDKKIADAYNLIDITIWEIIADILLADKQNWVLSKKDKKIIENLAGFRDRQISLLNSPGGALMIG